MWFHYGFIMFSIMVSNGTLKGWNWFQNYIFVFYYNCILWKMKIRMLVGIEKIDLSFLPISIPRNMCLSDYASVIL